MGKFKKDHHEALTPSQESPETKAVRLAFERWVGDANELIRKILVSDDALMDQAKNRIVAKVFTERHNGERSGYIKWRQALAQVSASLSDEHRSEVVRLWEKKKVARNRIAEALGGIRHGESYASMCQRVRHPWHTMKQTAAIMAHLGIYRSSPGEPVQAKRRTLSEADHDKRAREADEIAARMIP